MIKICEFCGNEFDLEDTKEEFLIETVRDYDRLTKCLCADCAIEAINNEVDGIYYDECSHCGAQFDPFDINFEFQRITGDDEAYSGMFNEPLCLDCMVEEYYK